MALDEPKKNEIPFLVNGIDVLIDDNIKAYAEGNIVDYVNEKYGGGFTIARADGHTC